MKQYTYTKTRENLRSIISQVCADHEPIRITRRKGDNVIVISEEDYGALVETYAVLGLVVTIFLLNGIKL